MEHYFVIEGVDGSGKATQTDLLYQALQKQDKPVRKVSFPNYDSPSSSLIKMYLNGEFGSDPQSVNAFATSVFFAVDVLPPSVRIGSPFMKTAASSLPIAMSRPIWCIRPVKLPRPQKKNAITIGFPI